MITPTVLVVTVNSLQMGVVVYNDHTKSKSIGEIMRNASFVMFRSGNLVFMNMRWDGRWGFPGGIVEADETTLDAAIRECEEEIGVLVSPDHLVYGGNHLVREGLTSHFYVCDVDYDSLIELGRQALSGTASHHDELCGFGIFDAACHDFTKMSLAPTVIDELRDTFGDRLVGGV